MKLITGILSCVILFAFVGKEDNKIYWSKDYQLKWEDFLGTIQNGKHGGMTNAGISAPFEYKGTNLETNIVCYFDKNKSWVKADEKTDAALKHEQGHFDIAEIYARKLRKEISSYKFKKKTLATDFNNLYRKFSNDMNTFQDLYDKETDHHKNTAKQTEWNEKIAKELQELEPYSETHLSIKVK